MLVFLSNKVMNDKYIPTHKLIITSGIERCNKYERYIKDDDLISFIEYIKTQSSEPDMDNWYVMKVIINRLVRWDCDWKTYYYGRCIANSNNPLYEQVKGCYPKLSFDVCNDKDLILLSRIKMILYEEHCTPYLRKDVLYFHSHKENNIGHPFHPHKEVMRLRHKFYKE